MECSGAWVGAGAGNTCSCWGSSTKEKEQWDACGRCVDSRGLEKDDFTIQHNRRSGRLMTAVAKARVRLLTPPPPSRARKCGRRQLYRVSGPAVRQEQQPKLLSTRGVHAHTRGEMCNGAR